MDKKQRPSGRSPYDVFGAAGLGNTAGTVGEFVRAMQGTVNADLAKTMRAMPWESITANAQQIAASAAQSARGVSSIADVIAREYGPALSSVSALSRMVNDANKENERLLRSLVNVGAVGQEAARSIPGINDAMRTAFEVPAIEAYREIMDGTITQFGSLTSESLRSLFESFEVAGSVARNAGTLARIAELQEQLDDDSEVEEAAIAEIEEALKDPKLRDLFGRVLGAITTYLTMLSAATGQRTSALLSSRRVRRHLAGAATAIIVVTATVAFPAAATGLGALGGWFFVFIEDALEDLAEEE